MTDATTIIIMALSWHFSKEFSLESDALLTDLIINFFFLT